MWNREHGTLIDTIEGHTASCNCVSWNPVQAFMFASAGDDHEIRMYIPCDVTNVDGQILVVLGTHPSCSWFAGADARRIGLFFSLGGLDLVGSISCV